MFGPIDSLRSKNAASLIPVVVLIMGGAILYRSCLNGYFLADDYGYIQLYSRMSLDRFPALFSSDWSQGIWGTTLPELRPLTGLTYWAEYKLWGVDARGYHATNLFLYLLAVAGLFGFLTETSRMLLKRSLDESAIRWTAIAATGLFLVHPGHVEATFWIAGRTDLLAACTYLWSLIFLIRFWQGGSAGLCICGIAVYAVGLFMKENVVTMPGVLVAFILLTGGFVTRWRRMLVVLAPLAGLAFLWVRLRQSAFGAVGHLDFGRLGGRLVFYAGEILPMKGKVALILLSIFFVLCAGCVIAAWTRSGRFFLFWITWTAIHLFPLAAVGYESPRHIFLIVAAPLVLLPVAIMLIWKRSRVGAVVLVVLAVVLMAGFVRTSIRALAEWERSSRYARQFIELFAENNYPADAVLTLDSFPDARTLFLHWALPFALEPPFSNVRARYVSRLNLYCCEKAFQDSREFLKEVDNGKHRNLYRIEFDNTADRFVSRRPPIPTGLKITPRTVSKSASGRQPLPACYTIRVENAEGGLVDVLVELPDKTTWSTEDFGWPQLDAAGVSAPVCVDSNSPTGKYTFLKVKNHGTSEWADVHDYVDVIP
jgi:hypothetical protein